jgi:hypothetical protein
MWEAVAAALPDGKRCQRGLKMYMQPRTQTITRRTIKRVENRLNGLADVTATTPDWKLGTPVGTIGSTSTSGSISMQQILDLLSGRLGQLKIDATQFAEGMVRLFYGMEPGCTMPQPGIPVVPNNSSPKFCATSIAGAIERCRINEASSSLLYAERQLQTRSNDGTPMAPYIKAWYDQYGRNDISYLNGVIVSARSVCGVVGDIPKVCTAPQIWCSSKLRCTHPEECSSGGISTTMLFGVAAVFALMMFMKR